MGCHLRADLLRHWPQVKRAYKRSALSHHPDKALAQCRFAARLGSLGVPVVAALLVCQSIRAIMQGTCRV